MSIIGTTEWYKEQGLKPRSLPIGYTMTPAYQADPIGYLTNYPVATPKVIGNPYMATSPVQIPGKSNFPPYATLPSTTGAPAAGALGTPAALATPATGAIETDTIGGGPAKSQRAVRARTKTMYSSYASQANVVRKILLGK